MAEEWTQLGLNKAKHGSQCLPDRISKTLYCLCNMARLLKCSRAWGQLYITSVVTSLSMDTGNQTYNNITWPSEQELLYLLICRRSSTKRQTERKNKRKNQKKKEKEKERMDTRNKRNKKQVKK